MKKEFFLIFQNKIWKIKMGRKNLEQSFSSKKPRKQKGKNK